MSQHHFVIKFDTNNTDQPFSLDNSSEVRFYRGSIYLPENEEWVKTWTDGNKQLHAINEGAITALESALTILNTMYKREGE